jgi:hypothetical protein
MGVNVCLPLFGNAGHELEEGARLESKQLRALAEVLRERLEKAAEILDRAQSGGWSAIVAMYDAFLTHPDVQTQAEAEQRLLALGIDLAELMIIEDEEEEEEV